MGSLVGYVAIPAILALRNECWKNTRRNRQGCIGHHIHSSEVIRCLGGCPGRCRRSEPVKVCHWREGAVCSERELPAANGGRVKRQEGGGRHPHARLSGRESCRKVMLIVCVLSDQAAGAPELTPLVPAIAGKCKRLVVQNWWIWRYGIGVLWDETSRGRGNIRRLWANSRPEICVKREVGRQERQAVARTCRGRDGLVILLARETGAEYLRCTRQICSCHRELVCRFRTKDSA